MLYFRNLVIFISMLSYGVSYGSHESIYDDKSINSNHTISYEDYKQSVPTDLLNLLTLLSSHYDEFRLPLRATEITVQCLSNFYLLKLGNTFRHEYLVIASFGFLLSFIANTSYDIRIYHRNHEHPSLLLLRLIAQRTEHISSLFVSDYLLTKLFSGICPICLDLMRYPIDFAGCRRHWFCDACLSTWQAQSLLCPVCRQ
ncbi:RING finger domain-containing protein [Endozoicomonas sp. 8E]|uniref:RING finger domain-containing protein n=1 Tax=Endozoicomonas sp. 8E TaxID=3035692 RepID=UPI003977B9D1